LFNYHPTINIDQEISLVFGDCIAIENIKKNQSWGLLHIPSKRFNPDPRKYRLTPGLAPELPIQD